VTMNIFSFAKISLNGSPVVQSSLPKSLLCRSRDRRLAILIDVSFAPVAFHDSGLLPPLTERLQLQSPSPRPIPFPIFISLPIALRPSDPRLPSALASQVSFVELLPRTRYRVAHEAVTLPVYSPRIPPSHTHSSGHPIIPDMSVGSKVTPRFGRRAQGRISILHPSHPTGPPFASIGLAFLIAMSRPSACLGRLDGGKLHRLRPLFPHAWWAWM
jgi:hypothetical protein